MSENTGGKRSLGAKTLAVPTPVWLVAAYDSGGKANVMTIAWGGICCSDPPCVAVSLRKATYTYGCITARRAFTVNVPGEELLKQTDLCGIITGKTSDKFKEAGFTAVKAEKVDAPAVQECKLILECRLAHTFELGLHTQFVGEIVDVKAAPEILTDGSLDMGKVKPMLFDPGTCSYFGTGELLGKAFSVGKKS